MSAFLEPHSLIYFRQNSYIIVVLANFLYYRTTADMKEQAGQSLSFKVPPDRGCLIGVPFKRPKQKSIR